MSGVVFLKSLGRSSEIYLLNVGVYDTFICFLSLFRSREKLRETWHIIACEISFLFRVVVGFCVWIVNCQIAETFQDGMCMLMGTHYLHESLELNPNCLIERCVEGQALNPDCLPTNQRMSCLLISCMCGRWFVTARQRTYFFCTAGVNSSKGCSNLAPVKVGMIPWNLLVDTTPGTSIGS